MIQVGISVINRLPGFSCQDSEISPAKHTRVLVLGGTGMVGQWCLHYLNHLGKQNQITYQVAIISRNPSSVLARLTFVPTNLDISTFSTGNLKETIATFQPSNIWHFAADTGSSLLRTRKSQTESDSDLAKTIADLIMENGLNCNVLYTSSGAVYGRRRTVKIPISEYDSVISISDESLDPYDVTKVKSEAVFSDLADSGSSIVGICRLFAFIGPLLPTDKHFAIGNFVGAASRGQPVVLNSSGRDYRSWLHCSDLARYLVTLSFATTSFVVNIGSSEWLTIRAAAKLVADIGGVALTEPPNPSHMETGEASFYVPDISRLRSMVNLTSTLTLAEAVAKTIDWHRFGLR